MPNSNNDEFKFPTFSEEPVNFEEHQHDVAEEIRPRRSRSKQPRQYVGPGTKRLKGRNKRDFDRLMDEAEAREDATEAQGDGDYDYRGNHYPYTIKMPLAVAGIITAGFFGCAWKACNDSPTHFWAPDETWFWMALGITNAACVLVTLIFCPIGTPSISVQKDQENSSRRKAQLMREWEYRNASPADRAAMMAMEVAPYLAASYVLKEMTDQVKADTARVDESLKRK